MKKTIGMLLLAMILTGCGDMAVASGVHWFDLPDNRGRVMCAITEGNSVSCDWDHAERTPR